MRDRAVGRDAGAEGFWKGRTLPVLGRPERLPEGTGGVGGSGAVIRVRVLGKPEIVDVPADLHVRKNATEFLTYLIVRGGNATQDDIADDLMPEPSRERAGKRMHTYTYNLRQVFARLGGDSSYLQLRRHQYVITKG